MNTNLLNSLSLSCYAITYLILFLKINTILFCVSPERNAYRCLIGTPEGKRPLGRLRCRQELILEWSLNNYNERAWSVIIWLRRWRSGDTPLSGVTYLINV